MSDPIVSTITSSYRAERYLETFLRCAAEQTIFDKIEIVLDHNDPSETELNLVRAFSERHPGRIRHIVTRPVRPLGSSWNACIRSAKGRYLTIWNVDDLRTPNSLEAQVTALMRQPQAGLVFGDFKVVSEFGSNDGTLVRNRDLPAEEHHRGMTIGPFFMFKAELCERAGLFDEQLLSGADFDFALRLLSHSSWTYTSELLGYFLSAAQGLSTRPDSLQWIEKNVVYMRYGIWDKFEIAALPRMRSYDSYGLLIEGKRVPVADGFRDYEETMRRRDASWLPLLNAPSPTRERLAGVIAAAAARARRYGGAARVLARAVGRGARGT